MVYYWSAILLADKLVSPFYIRPHLKIEALKVLRVFCVCGEINQPMEKYLAALNNFARVCEDSYKWLEVSLLYNPATGQAFWVHLPVYLLANEPPWSWNLVQYPRKWCCKLGLGFLMALMVGQLVCSCHALYPCSVDIHLRRAFQWWRSHPHNAQETLCIHYL